MVRRGARRRAARPRGVRHEGRRRGDPGRGRGRWATTGALAALQGELLVAIVPSEEDGGQGTLAAIRAGATGDLCVIPEPSSLDIVIAHAGAITFRLTVPGRAAHASRRLEGVSALDNLGDLVRALEADEARRNAEETDPLMTALGLPYPTIVGKVEGGEWASTVMDRVVAEGRYGVRLGQCTDEAEAELRAASRPRAPRTRSCATTRRRSRSPARGSRPRASRGPPAARVASRASPRAVTGSRPSLVGVPYGADMRLFVNEGDTPCVIFGPGDVRLAHGADECVPLAEVEACARVLAAWVATELGA